jgi:4-carboxymuconolactone decarboxylase
MSTKEQSAGETARREVMGTEFVDRALENASAFDMPMQEMTMEHGWGSVWTRDGLDRKTRSMVTVSMLIALNAHGALKGHVRGALNNGVSPAEIREIVMHAAVYCGYPAALAAMKVAREVIEAYGS